jgi:hypothetical protein
VNGSRVNAGCQRRTGFANQDLYRIMIECEEDRKKRLGGGNDQKVDKFNRCIVFADF